MMERLEGGLEKLKSTAAQVDDLKEKLKAQEVELKQKNEDADALIERVGVEQEKVGVGKGGREGGRERKRERERERESCNVLLLKITNYLFKTRLEMKRSLQMKKRKR